MNLLPLLLTPGMILSKTHSVREVFEEEDEEEKDDEEDGVAVCVMPPEPLFPNSTNL